MENSALRYKIYRVLLESDLTSEQREVILEGWFDNLKSWLGAVKDTGATDVGKIFKNAKYQRRVKVAADNISKEVDGLKAIAKDAGVSEEVAFELLNSILSGVGAEPSKIEKAAESPSVSGGSVSTSSAAQGGVKSGETVTTSNPNAVTTLVRAAAAATNQNPDKVVAQAEEKKINVPKATEVLAKAISSVSKVDAGKVSKILGFLIKNNHMVAEGRRVMSVDIKKAVFELAKRHNDNLILERWNSISGIKQVLKEEADEGKKKKFEDVLDDVRKAFKPEELSDDDIYNVIIALDDLDNIQIK